MEYFLCRAMEVGRLNRGQVEVLHAHEKKQPRSLQPQEIQELFSLPLLKEHYLIPPDDLSSQAVHNQRLRGDFRKADLYPKSGDLSETNVATVHEFDDVVLQALEMHKINLFYLGPTSSRKKFSEEVGA